jgi:uncharacterized repeat protein (TIGR01451 family)
VGVGFVYRLKISGMPEFPGAEFYPTIEILDCIHPPRGREYDFPVTISFSSDEIESVVNGRLVTKVIYLEQPQLAPTGDLTQALLNRMLPADRNLLIEADRIGRPMILVRLGGRTPSTTHPDFTFFGPPAPLTFARPLERPVDPNAGRAIVIDRATTFTPALPRATIEDETAVRLAGRRGLAKPTPPRAIATLEPPLPPWEIHPDEYLLDGGDRGLPVHETPAMREGLDSEDAVAEFADHTGKYHILPTNRVAIYSPRFGALAVSTGLETGVTVAGTASTVDSKTGEAFRSRVATTDHVQRIPSQSVRVRSSAGGFNAQQLEAAIHQRTTLIENRKLAGSVEGVQNENSMVFLKADAAIIGKQRQAAIAWTRDQYPVLTASIAGAQQVIARFIPSEMVGVEDRRRPGRLLIVKLADKQTALPGEIVNFRIEFENVGDLELRDVRIIDSLTPRLEYIAESGNSDRPAALDVADNGEGSAVLTWSLNEPLPGKTVGIVTFKARVR